MQSEVLALIVVYNQNPIETISLRTLVAAQNDSARIRLLIWDNSPNPHHVTEFPPLVFEDVTYVSTPENFGLSAIYNKVIKKYLQLNEYLLLLDQDSSIPIDFFERFHQHSSKHPEIDLFLPTIRANGRFVSPLPYFYGWGKYWKQPRIGIQRSKFCSAINSGMLISSKYLKGDFLGYDERLRFYGTDTQFMVTYATKRKHFFIMDAVIDHDLSFFAANGKERIHKFLEMKNAYDFIYEKHPLYRRALNSLVMIGVSTVYALRHRSLYFLKKK